MVKIEIQTTQSQSIRKLIRCKLKMIYRDMMKLHERIQDLEEENKKLRFVKS